MADLFELLQASLPFKKKTFRQEWIFRSGDPIRSVMAIESGRVHLKRNTVDGREIILHSYQAHDIIAVASLFKDAYQCGSFSPVESTLYCFDKQEIIARLESDPRFSLYFSSALSDEVHYLRNVLEIRNIQSAKERIIEFLRLHPGAALPIATTKKDIAVMVGLSPEAFYRSLSELKKEGIIRLENRSIILRRFQKSIAVVDMI